MDLMDQKLKCCVHTRKEGDTFSSWRQRIGNEMPPKSQDSYDPSGGGGNSGGGVNKLLTPAQEKEAQLCCDVCGV